MRRHTEDDLQMAVADYLRMQCPSLLWLHVPNGGKRNAREGARFKRMGVKPGVADILMFWRTGDKHHMAAIELKSEKGKQEPSQKIFQHNWTFLGGQYAICRSIDDVTACLKAWGAL